MPLAAPQAVQTKHGLPKRDLPRLPRGDLNLPHQDRPAPGTRDRALQVHGPLAHGPLGHDHRVLKRRSLVLPALVVRHLGRLRAAAVAVVNSISSPLPREAAVRS